jgi:hypothetical protein
MVVSASSCAAETNAPAVNTERPIRPEIGARMVVRPRSISAERKAARWAATSARAVPEAASASSYCWRETKSRLSSSAKRRTWPSAPMVAACARATAARALATRAS